MVFALTHCIIVIIVNGNHLLINFEPSEVVLICNIQPARILSVPCTSNADLNKLNQKAIYFFPLAEHFGFGKSTGCVTCH